MWQWLLRALARAVGVRASYDAAQTTADNRRHWRAADDLSASAALTAGVRKTIRERARYERDNNGYADGLVTALANDLIGTGPTLQVRVASRELATEVESSWREWADEVGLVDRLHLLRQAKAVDGEAFAILATNPALLHPVKLDVKPVECDQVESPLALVSSASEGIEFDSFGRPAAYYILREHPGGGTWNMGYDRVPAEWVLHWFRARRPGQIRGVSELASGLPLFAQLRRYTLAVLSAAETAASFAALIETDALADTAELVTPFETLEIERGMMTTLPAGARMKQLTPEQPATGHAEYKREVLREIGRPHGVPLNVVSGDSSQSNFSSARLDRLIYWTTITVDREHLRRAVLERIWSAWLAEAARTRSIPGLSPDVGRLPHTWYWPGLAAIDPQKEAAANTERLANGTATLASILAEEGRDWEDELEQRARELERARELGVDFGGMGVEEEAAPVDDREEDE